MFKLLLCGIASTSFFMLSVVTVQAADWEEVKGDHFIVYYKPGSDEGFAREVVRNAEIYYNRIASDLGYPRYSNFWQWENRVKIYIHSDEKEFQKMTGQPGWSHGMANYTTKEIHSFHSEENFMETLLPHEITHLIFRDFVGLEGQIPLWLDEGVAQWEEPLKRVQARKYARYLIQIDQEYPVIDLTTTNVQKLTDENKVHAFYMQSVSLVDFLVTTYGPNSFTEFCRQLRDGKRFQDALAAAYPNSISGYVDLENKWRKYVMEDPEQIEIYSH